LKFYNTQPIIPQLLRPKSQIFRNRHFDLTRSLGSILKPTKPAPVETETIRGTFKYHMTLREGVCSNRQSIVIWEEGIWPNRHITFTVVKKS